MASSSTPSVPNAADELALKQNRIFQFIVTRKGVPFPSKEELLASMDDPMPELVSSSGTYNFSALNQQIAQLRGDHLETLRQIYDHYSYEYKEYAIDRYMMKDDTQIVTDGDGTLSDKDPASAKSKSLDCLALSNQPGSITSLCYDHIADAKLAYLKEIIPLLKIKHDWNEKIEAEFPRTEAEFDSKDTKNKERIVSFLLAPTDREAMVHLFKWGEAGQQRRIQSLLKVYNENAAFKAKIQTMRDQTTTKDPRLARRKSSV